MNAAPLLTMTTLLRTIKKRMGIYYFKLPMSDQDLIDHLAEETLATYSIYFPHTVTYKTDLSQNKVPGQPDHYFIDTSYFEGVTILGVENVIIDSYYDAMYYPYNNMTPSYELFTDIQMAATFESMMSVPVTMFFVAPDKLKLESAPPNLSLVTLELNTTHPANLSTINLTYKEQLVNLGVLDLKIMLYEILKRFDKIDTTFGQIDLKIDDWSQAPDDRKSLISEFDANFLSSRKRKIYKA